LSGGKIHMPRQRFRHCSSSNASPIVHKKWDSMSGTIAARFRFLGSDAGSCARQNFLTGQTGQRGLRTVQISDPKSIIAF